MSANSRVIFTSRAYDTNIPSNGLGGTIDHHDKSGVPMKEGYESSSVVDYDLKKDHGRVQFPWLHGI